MMIMEISRFFHCLLPHDLPKQGLICGDSKGNGVDHLSIPVLVRLYRYYIKH